MGDRAYFGVDPGESVGLAVIYGGQLVRARQLPRAEALPLLRAGLEAYVGAGIPVLLSCERFTITRNTARHSAQPGALKMIGAIEALGIELDIEVNGIGPGTSKAIAPDSLLRRLGMLVPREDNQPDANDARDAVRQALTALGLRDPDMLNRMIRSATMKHDEGGKTT